MEDMTAKAIEIAQSILKDFHDVEALAVLEIAKILVTNN